MYNILEVKSVVKEDTVENYKVSSHFCVNKNRKRHQTLGGWFLIVFCFVSVFLVQSFQVGYFSNGVKQIVSSWAPSENIGKLKFVSSEESGSEYAMSFFSIDYSLPFPNGTVTEGSEPGEFIVDGDGEVLVVAPYKSKVKEIGVSDNKRTITFDCGFSVKVVYLNLDNVGVNVSDSVKKGDGVGVANSSVVKVRVYFRDKLYTKIKLKDNKLSI